MGQQGFTAEAAAYKRRHAWICFTQGDPQGAVDQLQNLIERLRHKPDVDLAFEWALTIGMLGRVLDHAGISAQAIPTLRETVGLWEALVEKVGGQPWEELLASPEHAKATIELGNLSAAMGDLANALGSAGRHDEALAMAEKGLWIQEMRGDQRNIAASRVQCAKILSAAGRYDEAGTCYDLALAATRQAADKGLEGIILQNQGLLALNRNQLDRATHLYQKALELFREASDQLSMVRTYNLIGVAEQKADRLPEARLWYEKSRELAARLKDQTGLGDAAQNIGIAWQQEGEAARDRGDEPDARRHFEEARRFVEECLEIKHVLGNRPDEASALVQLAQIDLRLGNLDRAEQNALRGLAIDEELQIVRELPSDYNTLAEIAQARGDTVAAAEWAKKRDDLLEELERRAGGGGGLPAQMLKALQALTVACVQAGFGEGSLSPAEEEALAKLDGGPAPYPAFAAFLRQIAAGQPAPIPGGLPEELREWLEGMMQAPS